MTATVGPATGGIFVQFLDPQLGQTSAREDPDADAPAGQKAYTGRFSPVADFVQISAISVAGRDVSTDRASVDIDACTGTKTFRTAAPSVAEPAPADLEIAAAEPETAEPATTEPEPDTPAPETAEPVMEEPETAEPAMVAPEPPAPETVEPVMTEPEALECAPGTQLSADGTQCVAAGADSACLIATAAYGTELAQQVQALREIRDGTLYTTE